MRALIVASLVLVACGSRSTLVPSPADAADVASDAGADAAADAEAAAAADADANASPILRPNGQPCGASHDCLSGVCVEGVCCDGACDGPCVTCAAANTRGTCSPKVAGTSCAAGRCEGAAVVEARVCDGLGNCRPGPAIVCAPFGCDPATGACVDMCRSDRDCVAPMPCVNGNCARRFGGCLEDAECGSDRYCAPNRDCLPPQSGGAPCTANRQCESRHCIDGLCTP